MAPISRSIIATTLSSSPLEKANYDKNTITYLLGLALLGLSGFTISEQIQNVMSCTIKSIQVTDIVDGKVKTYTGYKEGLEHSSLLIP